MGSRQRPARHIRSETGGRQARAGSGGAGEREAATEQRRHEEEMLSDAREDAEDPFPPDDSPRAATPNEG